MGLAKIKEHAEGALTKEAMLVCGGKKYEAGDLFFEPTLICDMTPDMLLKEEETFGAVAGVFRFSTEDASRRPTIHVTAWPPTFTVTILVSVFVRPNHSSMEWWQ